MLGAKWIVAGAALAVLAGACGGDDAPSGGTGGGGNGQMGPELREALVEVESTVDELVAEVAPEAETAPRRGNGKARSCGEAEGEHRSHFGYVVDVEDPIATLHQAHSFFAAHGLDVDTAGLTADPPSLTAEGDGFGYAAIVVSGSQIVIDGTTPCLAS